MRGSKRETAPGVWRLRAYVGRDPITGAEQQASRTFRGSARDADTALARLVIEAADGRHATASTTVAGLLSTFCDHSERIGRSPTTIEEYRRMSAALANGVGSVALADLTPHHLDRLYGVLASRGIDGGRGPLSAASVNRYHDMIKAACRQAVKWGWLAENPAERATPPSEHPKRVASPSPVDLRQLIETAAAHEPRYGILLVLAAITGARRGELCALRWSDVDLAAGVVHIRRSAKQVGREVLIGTTKTHQERTVAIPPEAVALLAGWRRTVDDTAARSEIPLVDDPYVFSAVADYSRPMKPATLSSWFASLARRTGMPYHLHQLRHFAATQLIGAGVDAVTVANRLGHSDPAITLRVYAHAIKDRDRAAAAQLGALVVPELPTGE